MTDLAVPGTEGFDCTAQHDDLFEPLRVRHNAVKPAHFSPPAAPAALQPSSYHPLLKQIKLYCARSEPGSC